MTGTDTGRTDAEATLARSLDLLAAGDARGWVDLFADDGVLEFPYAPPGWPNRFVGREDLWSHMQKFPEHLSVSFTEPTFYPSADPNFTVAEFHGSGRSIAADLPFEQDYVSVLWSRDGRIVRYRDFWNPVLHMQALGGADAAAAIVSRD